MSCGPDRPHAAQDGMEDMADPLVFVPGLGCDLRLFAQQATVMGRRRMVSVAPVGQGERMEEIASELLSQLPARFALCGYGFGGAVAMEILRRAPDRVLRLALISCTPLADTPQEAAAREPWIVKSRAGRLDDALKEALPAATLAPGPRRADYIAAWQRMARDGGPQAFEKQNRALQRRRDQQATLRKCKVPTRVICGEYDTLTPVKRHEFMAELIPTARLSILPDAGHLPSWETPEALIEVLEDWMKQPVTA
jgi:pimeloyl-ACP methyl ester carboxylesterase